MAQESVLEFRIGEEIYCFNTKIVKYVFDLEEFDEIEGMDEVVFGLVHYDDDAMLLIDTLFLYTKKKHIKLDGSKSVVVIEDEHEALYGMVVDEIVKIEDVEPAPSTLDFSSEELIIRHYKERDKLVNEVVPIPLLHVKKIPSFKKELGITEEENTLQNREQKEFLLFMVDQKLFALDTANVKEVVEKESELFELEYRSTRFKGAVAVREDVYKVANLKPEAKEGSELVVIEKENECFCVQADKVFGIEYFDTRKIDTLADTLGYITGFYNKDGEVVAILDANFFVSHRSLEKEESKIEEKGEEQKKLKQRGFLLFRVGEKEFAFDMKYVRQVVEKEDIPHTDSSALSSAASSNIAFISEWNHHGVDVFSLEKIMGLRTHTESNEVIMLETEHEKFLGLLVESVEDIYYAKQEDIAVSVDKEALIDATLFKEGRVVPVLNPSSVIS